MTASARSRATKSKRATGSSKRSPSFDATALYVGLVLLGIGAAFAGWIYRGGGTLLYGDANAHLNIARRIIDSKTPGLEQTGTVWLPLLHWLLIPFVRVDSWWQSGLAGVFISVISFVCAGVFLYFAASRALGEKIAGVAAALAFALNPNMLYLQSIPMTESLFLACETGLIAALVWFAQSGRFVALLVAGVAGFLGSLTRYDGWFLLPFAAAVILITAKKNRWTAVGLFSIIAGAGPVSWLLHNRWYFSNWLEFYNGPYAPKAIQGSDPYPGMGNWPVAFRYYAAAARECTGLGLLLAGPVGLLGVFWRRAWIPLLILCAVPLFYIWSIHSGSTPVKVPDLWPGGYYNSRYGIVVLPLAAFAAAGLVIILPRFKALTVTLVAFVSLAPWIFYPRTDNWITFKESIVNSNARRAWTSDAAGFFKREYKRGDGVYSAFGDLTGIFREAGIPLRETMHEGNGLAWFAAQTRPDLFFWQKWAVVRGTDRIATELRKRKVECVRIIRVSGAPTIEIFRNEHPLSQGTRRPK